MKSLLVFFMSLFIFSLASAQDGSKLELSCMENNGQYMYVLRVDQDETTKERTIRISEHCLVCGNAPQFDKKYSYKVSPDGFENKGEGLEYTGKDLKGMDFSLIVTLDALPIMATLTSAEYPQSKTIKPCTYTPIK